MMLGLPGGSAGQDLTDPQCASLLGREENVQHAAGAGGAQCAAASLSLEAWTGIRTRSHAGSATWERNCCILRDSHWAARTYGMICRRPSRRRAWPWKVERIGRDRACTVRVPTCYSPHVRVSAWAPANGPGLDRSQTHSDPQRLAFRSESIVRPSLVCLSPC